MFNFFGSLTVIVVTLAALYACNNNCRIRKNCCFTKTCHHAQTYNNGKSGSFHGRTALNGSSHDNLSINGSGNLSNVTVTGSLSSNGSLKLSESTIESLTSNGGTNLQNTIVNGPCTVRGSLYVDSSTLSTISVSSTNITFYNSKTKSIRVENTSRTIEHIVDLNNTTIDGDIVFESGNGKVLLKGDSKITGEVLGGQVVESSR